MRVAIVSDVHGNLPALQAVLSELDEVSPDAIVSGGDVVGGPFVAECLAALRERPEPLHWVKGNGEREAVAAFDDAASAGDDHAGIAARHSAAALTRADRDELAGWPIALRIDGTCVCHGSPRSEDEVLTRATPEPALRAALSGVDAELVVGGHTHQQMVRALTGDPDYANAGSVGLPYEGDPAAYWMLLVDGAPELRRTAYDVAAAVERIRASDFPDIREYVDGALDPVVSADWVTAFFEHGAGRGDHPGPPVYVG